MLETNRLLDTPVGASYDTLSNKRALSDAGKAVATNWFFGIPQLAAYNFDATSGPVVDISGNNRGFTLTGATVRTASGHTSQGLTQTASDIQVGPALTGLQTGNRTVMAWVKETAAATGWALEQYVTTLNSGSWGILFLSSQWHIQARNAGGFVRATVARPVDNLWHHVAGTYDGINVQLYLDGVLAATTAMTGPLRTDADVFRFLDSTSSHVTIDDVRLYDQALDASTITTLMNTPVSSGSGINFTQAPVDNLGLTDTLSIALDKSVTDNLGLTDTPSIALDKSVTDNLGLTDSIIIDKGAAVSVVDPLGLTDSIGVDQGKGVVDPLGLTDSVGFDQAKGIVDPLGLTDSVTIARNISLVITDSMGITDSAVVDKGLALTISDTVGLTDAVSVVLMKAVDVTIDIGPSRVGIDIGPSRIGVDVGVTRGRAQADVDVTRSRSQGDVGVTRSRAQGDVGVTRQGWVIGGSRQGLDVGVSRKDR